MQRFEHNDYLVICDVSCWGLVIKAVDIKKDKIVEENNK